MKGNGQQFSYKGQESKEGQFGSAIHCDTPSTYIYFLYLDGNPLPHILAEPADELRLPLEGGGLPLAGGDAPVDQGQLRHAVFL